jgi:hypothetical protein
MLERGEIARVLQEQQISLAGVVGANEAVKAGQLLHADLFAVVEGTPGNDRGENPPLGLVVFDARTGVRYADAELAESNTLAAASAVAAGLRAAVAKSRQPASQLHTVCLLLVRNADLPAEYNRLCDSVGPLLERELTALPDLAVLERGRLAQVNEERKLAPEENQLLSSLQMIELDVSRDGEGLRGTIGVTGADGTRTNGITAAVPARDPAALARALAKAVSGLLASRTGVIGPGDRLAEARRFHREMDALQKQQDYLGALRAMEAAYALAPDEPGYRLDMVRCLCDGATEYLAAGAGRGGLPTFPAQMRADMPTALALGNRAADLLLGLCREAKMTLKRDDPPPVCMRSAGRLQLCGLLSSMAKVGGMDESDQAGLAALLEKERELRMDVLEPFWRERVMDATTLGNYAKQMVDWCGRLGFEQLETNQWQEDKLQLLRHWVETSRRINPPDGSGDYLAFVNAPFFLEPQVPAYAEFLASLDRDPDPVIRLNARVGLIAVNKPAGWTGWQDARTIQAVHNFRLYAEDLLDYGMANKPGPLREHVWSAMEDALGLIDGRGTHGDEWLAASLFAIAQKDFRNGLFRQTVDRLKSAQRDPAEMLEIVDGALALLRDHFGDNPGAGSRPATSGRGPTNASASSVQQERDRLIGDFQLLRNQVTGAASKSAAAWTNATCLLDLSEPVDGFHWLFKPVGQDGVVYGAALGLQAFGQADDALQLVRISLASGARRYLSRTGPSEMADLPEIRPVAVRFHLTNTSVQWNPLTATAACVGGDRYFLGTASRGVYIFPFAGGPVERYCTTNGLPSDEVTALAFLDGRLYVTARYATALGERKSSGYVISYDPVSRRMDTLVSSRRGEHLSPFDDQTAFNPFSLEADPARHRLILGANTETSGGPITGFWSITPETRRMDPLAVVDLGPSVKLSGSDWVGTLDANTVGLFRYTNDVAGLNQDRNRSFYVFSVPSAGSNRATWRTVAHGEALPGFLTGLAPRPELLVDGWLWTDRPFMRISFDAAKVEQLPSLTSDHPFRPSECLQMLDSGNQLLAGDQFSLWLLDLANEPAGAAAHGGGHAKVEDSGGTGTPSRH